MPTKKKESEAKGTATKKQSAASGKNTDNKEPEAAPNSDTKLQQQTSEDIKKDGDTGNTKTAQSANDSAAQDDSPLKLAGYLQGWCEQGLNVSLNDVPDKFVIINLQYATLDNYAVVKFDPCSTNVNIMEIREARKQRKIKVMLAVGGPNGNFNFLNNSGNVTNFYNSLWTLYQSWGIDGVTFDIQQLDKKNRQFVIDGIRKFIEICPDAMISIAAQPTFVCPAYDSIDGVYNQLVPVISYEHLDSEGGKEFVMADNIDLIQVLAFNYGEAYDKLRNRKTSPPVDIPTDPGEMLDYIFNCYIKPFSVSESSYESDSQTFDYPGFSPEKMTLGLISFQSSEYTDYVPPDKAKTALAALSQKYGATIFNINYDAQTNYAFTDAIAS